MDLGHCITDTLKIILPTGLTCGLIKDDKIAIAEYLK